MFLLNNFHKTPLYIAVEKRHSEIVQLLLGCPTIDVNMISILNHLLN